ncbi:MAG: 2-phospho-L-lactate guanylyltransferase [Polyangiaceae bacterium]
MKRPVWAIVPAKSWLHGKSRLRPALGDDDRALFAKGLLEHVLGVLGACALDGLLVATGGDDVASLAVASGAHVLWDANNGGGSLAAIVDRALAEVASRGAATALVLMADLPRIDAEDIRALLAALDDHDVALVRDHLGHHTNALAISPPTAMATSFGRDDSFAAHSAAAHAAGLRVAVVENDHIAFDVDVPADHERLTARRPAVET